jgi:hypothetical protein
MPALLNPRHESFAKARAKGARLEDAYEEAGFAPDRGHASRLAARPEVAGRIAELRAEQDARESRTFDHDTVISFLMNTYVCLKDSSDPLLLKEARLCLVEAIRLRNEKMRERDLEREALYAAVEARSVQTRDLAAGNPAGETNVNG